MLIGDRSVEGGAINPGALNNLLDSFSVQELADALFQASLPQGGAKAERIDRLVRFYADSKIDAAEFFSLFSADALRVVCDTHSIQRGRKDQMAAALVALLGGVLGSALVPQKTAAELLAEPEYLPPTKAAVLSVLETIILPARRVRSEADAHELIVEILGPKFAAVADQYSVGGFNGWRIDIDIGNGKVGVEVKLAASLQTSSAEMQRLVGQAVYYRKKRYDDNLIVGIVGEPDDLKDPVITELRSFLEELGITCVRLPLS